MGDKRADREQVLNDCFQDLRVLLFFQINEKSKHFNVQYFYVTGLVIIG